MGNIATVGLNEKDETKKNFAIRQHAQRILGAEDKLSAIDNPSASVTPTVNGQLVFEATSNTQLKIKYKGSDGTVRSATLTLS